MRIAYVGNFSLPFCTEVHLALTLENLGHEVTRLQEDALTPGFLAPLVHGHDLLLWTRTWEGAVTNHDLAEVANLGVPSASYHLDLYVGIQRENGLDRDPFWRTDFVFTPDGDAHSAEVFAAKGIHHHYMKPGIYKGECVKGTPRPEFTHDVAFVGGGVGYHERDWPYRGHLVTWLRDTYPGPQYGKYGYPEATIRNLHLNDLYASVKVVVGDSLCKDFTHQFYWSDRVYETTGRGGFIIHPRIKGLEEEFVEGQEIVFYDYGDFGQLKEKIDHYVSHDAEREAIREAGFQRTQATHTYNDRLAAMLEVVNR